MRPQVARLCLWMLAAGTVLCLLALPLADAMTMAAFVYGDLQP